MIDPFSIGAVSVIVIFSCKLLYDIFRHPKAIAPPPVTTPLQIESTPVPPPKDDLTILKETCEYPIFYKIAENIQFTKKQILVGTKRVGARAVGVLQEEVPYPSDTIDIRPMRDISELGSVLSSEWALDDDIFDAKLAMGELLTQVPVQNTLLMEDVYEPEYRDVVRTLYVLLDVSPSMFFQTGESWRIPIWKGTTVRLLLDAVAKGATFTLRFFSNTVSKEHQVVNLDQAISLGKKILNASEGSGTDIGLALRAALTDIKEMNYDLADIFIITDGEDEGGLSASFRGILVENRIKLHALMLGSNNEALRACCDSYQIVEHTYEGVQLRPKVCVA